ncbi:MAG TPA: hypothetical protein VGX25_10420 [Actinophytocola sp.]|uniref:hypothetical protein n=1 Tax=Actinophytocola sp. TaxID=1872138 RepID=UPI002DDCB847|nr:hypothetical protein [Actinophytocola sp.]HEV2779799.1 hypothetical protein [Actinophytocola sp.]
MPTYTLLVPLAAIGVLALVLRWALSQDTDEAHRKDYGLLREVAKVPSPTAARVVEQRLQEAGVRSTTVPAEDGNGMRIMVFPGDENTAIQALLRD